MPLLDKESRICTNEADSQGDEVFAQRIEVLVKNPQRAIVVGFGKSLERATVPEFLKSWLVYLMNGDSYP